MVYYYQSLEQASEEFRPHLSRRLKILCTLSAILNLVLLLLVIVHLGGKSPAYEPYIYSPAEDFISQKLVKFTRGLAGDVSMYERRRSPAVDAAWEDLYSVAQIKMPRSEVVKMPNRTWPLSPHPGEYTFSLDVFHQLHCLRFIQSKTTPKRLVSVLIEIFTHVTNFLFLDFHLRHCLGAIRQAIMCSVDITSVVWQWSDDLKLVEQRDDVFHVCRDYDRIRDWASQRTYPPEDFNETLDVADAWYLENDGN
ncbi:hypothetical protein B0H16DRAFT_1723590 [Mycena metata]|uniref:Cyclochlorotine biosynthesis protein O n=1 Tax=Mycena metata TaxID=1033252 RepID=A0AAD7J1U3_9AGAR|nr:hypothetical protein B0H16DRAFT_1723590 [Mycena metata]